MMRLAHPVLPGPSSPQAYNIAPLLRSHRQLSVRPPPAERAPLPRTRARGHGLIHSEYFEFPVSFQASHQSAGHCFDGFTIWNRPATVNLVLAILTIGALDRAIGLIGTARVMIHAGEWPADTPGHFRERRKTREAAAARDLPQCTDAAAMLTSPFRCQYIAY